jgi:hypothetical protein
VLPSIVNDPEVPALRRCWALNDSVTPPAVLMKWLVVFETAPVPANDRS